jgi:hypothetical protein
MSWKLGIRALVSVDRGMELLSTRPWFKSEVDTQNSREESNITTTLEPSVPVQRCFFVFFKQAPPPSFIIYFTFLYRHLVGTFFISIYFD